MGELRLKILGLCDKCDKSSKLKPIIIEMSLNKLVWVSIGLKKCDNVTKSDKSSKSIGIKANNNYNESK
jgi:hypothetical protein